MSGGSYSYICWKGSSDIGGYRQEVGRMAARLDGLGYHVIAADTRAVLAKLDELDAMLSPMERPWRAIEWWDSHDWGEDQAREWLDEYMARRFPTVDAIPPWRRNPG